MTFVGGVSGVSEVHLPSHATYATIVKLVINVETQYSTVVYIVDNFARYFVLCIGKM